MYLSSDVFSEYCSINTQSGYLKITFSQKYSDIFGRLNLSMGKDTPNNYQKASQALLAVDEYITQQIAKKLSVDIEHIKTIVNSIKRPHLIIVETTPTVRTLWNYYVEHHTKSNLWSQTYILTHIQTVTNLINRKDFPNEIEQPSLIMDWLLEGKRSVKTARDRFKLIVTAIDWCSKNQRCTRVLGLKYRDCLASFLDTLKVENELNNNTLENEESENYINPFGVEEINLILDALKKDTFSRFKGKHSQYYNYVYFCWLTGCRPSEAIALKWNNVDFQRKRIKFCEGLVIASGKIIKKRGTKTEDYRFVPMNNTLIDFLGSLPQISEYVFTSAKGLPINQHTFNGVWKRLLPQLGLTYRVPYQLRHSMISYHVNNNGFPL